MENLSFSMLREAKGALQAQENISAKEYLQNLNKIKINKKQIKILKNISNKTDFFSFANNNLGKRIHNGNLQNLNKINETKEKIANLNLKLIESKKQLLQDIQKGKAFDKLLKNIQNKKISKKTTKVAEEDFNTQIYKNNFFIEDSNYFKVNSGLIYNKEIKTDSKFDIKKLTIDIKNKLLQELSTNFIQEIKVEQLSNCKFKVLLISKERPLSFIEFQQVGNIMTKYNSQLEFNYSTNQKILQIVNQEMNKFMKQNSRNNLGK